MLCPKKTKYKKLYRGRISGKEYRVNRLAFGSVGVKVLKSGRINAKQLEALRKQISKRFKDKIWLRVFPWLCVTSKPTEVRMGKGKGSIDYWCSPVKAGRILFEMQNDSKLVSKEVLKTSRNKLSLPIKLVFR